MPIQAGTRLGPYEVTAFIGAGGMGEVYRARDGRLNRDVAIKVLPEGVSRDQESRSRFERETQAVAALSHPNVLAIFDTGSHDGRLFAVTELLDGQTLRDRLRAGPLPVRKALDWAVQIARGLAAAHDKQLVHRDIKPENVFVTTDGRIKILDFGLAKAPRETDAAAETVADATGAGVVLGTAGYMAPEQVRGQATDARTDLFGFGAVLYEMLTGARAFRRDTVAETMTAILHDDPPEISTPRQDLPPALERIVRHCLEKQPQERFQTARDVAFALETLSAASSVATGAAAATPPVATRRPIARVAIGATLAVVLIAAGWFAAAKLGWVPGPGTTGTAPIAIGASTQITTDPGLEVDAALSPDGKLLAYAAGRATGMRIYIRPVAGGRTLTLSEGSAAVEFQPRWSPDGSEILYLTSDGAFVASALGGASRRVVSGAVTSAAWAPDGKRLLVARPASLSVVSLDGAAERLLAESPEIHSCAWSPVDDWVACVSGNLYAALPGLNFGNVAPSAIVLFPTRGGATVTVADRTASNVSPVFSADGGDLYYVSNREGPRDIYVVGLRDVTAARPTPLRVTTGMGVYSIAFDAKAQRLAYVSYAARANIFSLPIPAGGTVDASAAKPLTTGSQIVESLRVSPDGKWLVFDSTLNLNAEVYRMPLDGGATTRLTTDPADDFAPDLSPDGREVAYHSWRAGSRDIYVQAIDDRSVQAITKTARQEAYPIWSPDGTRLAFVDMTEMAGGRTGRLLVTRRASGAWSAPVLVSDRVTAGQGAWLGDGSLVYATTRGIEAFPVEGGAPQFVCAVSSEAGNPWNVIVAEDGRTLYFKSRDEQGRSSIWAVSLSGCKPRKLVYFTDPDRTSIRGDFAAGGGRFFFTLEDRQADIWVAEVGKR